MGHSLKNEDDQAASLVGSASADKGELQAGDGGGFGIEARSSGAQAVGTRSAESLERTDPPEAAPSPKDVALALLSGGEEGIRVWNERRAREPDAPDLNSVDLSGLRLDGVNFARCTLRNVNFEGARLPGAIFDDADLRGAHFEKARMEYGSLKNARLANAKLTGANLRWCKFGGADLRNADFSDAIVEPCDFSMTDLAGAKLSSELLASFKDAVSHIETGGQHPRAVFFSLLTLCGFAVITAAGAPDIALISDRGSVKIPVLQNDVSVRAFFFLAPVLCMIFLSYIAIYLRYLSGRLLQLPLRLPDGAQIAEALSPWMLNIAPSLPSHLPTSADETDDNRSSDLGGNRRVIVFVTRSIVPLTMMLMFALFLGSHREHDLWAMYVLSLGGLALASTLWSRPIVESTSTIRFVSMMPVRAFVTSLTVGALLGALAIFAVTQGHILRVQGRGAQLGGTHFEHVSLVRADLSSAVLKGATFYESNCREAIFYRADMSRIGGKCGQFAGARFDQADLQSAWLTCAKLEGAHLNEARLAHAMLKYANLQGAQFLSADLTDANLSGADLRGAMLAGAGLLGTKLDGAWCDEKTSWPAGFDPKAQGLDCTASDPSAAERLSCDPHHEDSSCATGPSD